MLMMRIDLTQTIEPFVIPISMHKYIRKLEHFIAVLKIKQMYTLPSLHMYWQGTQGWRTA